MNTERLVRMANEISRFFESESVREEAVAGVLNHITRFWDPRMRRGLIAHFESGGTDLSELALAAVAKLAAQSISHATRSARQ